MYKWYHLELLRLSFGDYRLSRRVCVFCKFCQWVPFLPWNIEIFIFLKFLAKNIKLLELNLIALYKTESCFFLFRKNVGFYNFLKYLREQFTFFLMLTSCWNCVKIPRLLPLSFTCKLEIEIKKGERQSWDSG